MLSFLTRRFGQEYAFQHRGSPQCDRRKRASPTATGHIALLGCGHAVQKKLVAKRSFVAGHWLRVGPASSGERPAHRARAGSAGIAGEREPKGRFTVIVHVGPLDLALGEPLRIGRKRNDPAPEPRRSSGKGGVRDLAQNRRYDVQLALGDARRIEPHGSRNDGQDAVEASRHAARCLGGDVHLEGMRERLDADARSAVGVGDHARAAVG